MHKPKYLDKIEKFYDSRKRMPSYREIMVIVGFHSKNAVYGLVNKLKELGFLEKDKEGKIIPGPKFGGVSVLGEIKAGFPSPAEEELTDTMTLDEYLIGNREATYMLKVDGDSMIDAGIMPGDMVLVERTNNARQGDIVIAEVDGEWTMKYLQFTGKKPILVPANKKYKPIMAEYDLKVSARVKAVIRKY